MRCPSLNIFGTFFPSWMLCTLVGIAVAIAAHKALSRLGIDVDLSPALLLYPSITAIVTFVLWLGIYGH